MTRNQTRNQRRGAFAADEAPLSKERTASDQRDAPGSAREYARVTANLETDAAAPGDSSPPDTQGSFESHCRDHHRRMYAHLGKGFEDHRPYYEFGSRARRRAGARARFADEETALARQVESRFPGTRFSNVRDAVYFGWKASARHADAPR